MLNLKDTNMKLCDEGHFLLNDAVANGLIKGEIFGLNLSLWYEDSNGVHQDKPLRFIRDKGSQIAGTVDLGNGERRRLIATFTRQHNPARFNYVISEIPEDDSSDDRNIGKD